MFQINLLPNLLMGVLDLCVRCKMFLNKQAVLKGMADINSWHQDLIEA